MADDRPTYLLQIISDYEAMCQEVLEQINRVSVHVKTPIDDAAVSLIQHHERVIDGMEVKLHNDVMRAIVLYSPKATESRQIISYFDMAGNLERVGDLALNIMGYFQRINYQGPVYDKLQQRIDILFNLVKSMLQTAIIAFTCGDADTARELISDDDRIDDLYKEICDNIPQVVVDCNNDLKEIDTSLQIFALSYCLERIGDHASNIAESIIYTYEGTLQKHLHQMDI